jgi:hypothetical protein
MSTPAFYGRCESQPDFGRNANFPESAGRVKPEFVCQHFA